MTRLPNPGGDEGTWGQILNDFLTRAHNDDGTIKSDAIATQLPDATIPAVKLDTATQTAISQATTSVQSVNGKTPNSSGVVTLTPSDIGAASTLAGLSDVNVSGASGNQLLSYDVTAHKWMPITPSGSGVVLDSTTADIASLGTPAAGSVGKAADAGHVHAMPRLDQLVTPTADVSLNSHKLTNVTPGVNPTDVATVSQLGATATPADGSVTSAKIASGGLDPSTITGGALVASQLGATNGIAQLDGTSKLIQNIDASKITTGTLSAARLPDLSTTYASAASVSSKLDETTADGRYIRTVNSATPDGSGNVAVSASVDAAGTVPYHDHRRLWNPITWYYTRNEGTTLTFVPNNAHTYVAVLNDNATLNLGTVLGDYSVITSPIPMSAPIGAENYGQGVDIYLNPIRRDPFGSFGTSSWLQSAVDISIIVLQDDVGSHTVSWKWTYNNGSVRPLSTTIAASLAVSGVTGTTVPAPQSAANAATLYSFRWMGWQIGWMLIGYSANVFLQFQSFPSSVSSGCPSYTRIIDTDAYDYTNVSAPNRALVLSAISTNIPSKLRQFTYNLGHFWEINNYSGFSIVSGSLATAVGLTSSQPSSCWIGVQAAQAQGWADVICHEFGHALDFHLYNELINGVTVTLPDTNPYYWQNSRFGTANSPGQQIAGNTGDSRQIYRVHEDPAIQNMWLASWAYWNANRSGAIQSYYVNQSTQTNPAFYGGLYEWTAQMLGGYLVSTAGGGDTYLTWAATPDVITQFKAWAASNTHLQMYMS